MENMERKLAFSFQEFVIIPDYSRHHSRREQFDEFFRIHDDAWFYLKPSVRSGLVFHGLYGSLDEVADSEALTPYLNVHHVVKRCGFYISDRVVMAGDSRDLPPEEREHRNPEFWVEKDWESRFLTEEQKKVWEAGYVPQPEEMLKIVQEELAGRND
ncbi:MAG: hypothetical protein ABIE94_01715 [archaeon]